MLGRAEVRPVATSSTACPPRHLPGASVDASSEAQAERCQACQREFDTHTREAPKVLGVPSTALAPPSNATGPTIVDL